MSMASKSLIICPVGNPLTFDDRFDSQKHWRYTDENRLYETVVFAYSDFLPENNTYDNLIKEKGFKWSLSKKFTDSLDYAKYEYIGFMDDDLITDMHNINNSLLVAKENDLKIFQMSVTEDSDEFFPILKNKPEVKYTKTNFVETMGMFIHSSLMPTVIDFWKSYDIYCGWGFDKVLCDITKTDAAVIHSSQMYHPKKDVSTYNKKNAFMEMNKVLFEVTPKFMRDKYNENWSFVERQYEKQIVMEIK
jgi:hypothetical protein